MILKIIIISATICCAAFFFLKERNSNQKNIDDYFNEKNIIDVKKHSISSLTKKINELIGQKVILYLSTEDISASGIIKDISGEYIELENTETKEIISVNCIDIDFVEVGAELPVKKKLSDKTKEDITIIEKKNIVVDENTSIKSEKKE